MLWKKKQELNSTILFQDVMESLDADSIYQVAIDCYNKAQVSHLQTTI